MILSVYSGADQIAHLIEVILLFAVVLVATYYTTRFIAGYEKGKLSAGNLKIIDTMRLSQNKILQIIRVGDKYLAIAVCKDSVTVLCELSEDEVYTQAGLKAFPSLSSFKDKFKGKGKDNGGGFEDVLKDAIDTGKENDVFIDENK